MLDLTLVSVEVENRSFCDAHSISAPTAGSVISLGDELGQGGFGSIRSVQNINGNAPTTPLVAKVFESSAVSAVGGPQVLIERVSALNGRLSNQVDPSWAHQLLALPFVMATGRTGRDVVLVTLMLDLFRRGFEPIELDGSGATKHRALPMQTRVRLAEKAASNCALLESIGYIHGDLNLPNLLADRASGNVQILDLDSGAVLITGTERPLSPGKPESMPPEVKVASAGTNVDMSLFTQEAERWSIGQLIGWLLLAVDPIFFLKASSREVIRNYATDPRGWPHIDPSSGLFTRHEPNKRAYGALSTEFDRIPPAVRDTFRRLYQAGLDATNRPTATEWMTALSGIQRPPDANASLITLDRQIILEGQQVLMSWQVPGADQVEIGHRGAHPPVGALQLAPNASGPVRLVAINSFGVTELWSPSITVVEPPRLVQVPVPKLASTVTVPAVRIPRIGAPTAILITAPTPLRVTTPPALGLLTERPIELPSPPRLESIKPPTMTLPPNTVRIR